MLLRFAQVGYLDTQVLSANRPDVLRLVMFWLLQVHDPRKASEVAYRLIQEFLVDKASIQGALGFSICQRLIKEGYATPLYAPLELQACPGLVWSTDSGLLRSHERFETTEERLKPLYGFYRNWWRPWTYHHPLLLWLQRSYVSRFQEDPLAGREEDTPYDFDHILPHNHWGDWRGTSANGHPDRLPNFAAGDLGVVGNGIGNVRVWGSSENRSDGDTAPAIKLALIEVESTAQAGNDAVELLMSSAIPDSPESRAAWIICSGIAGKERSWDEKRALAFQRAIELRAFSLYCRYFDDLGFSNWFR